MTELMPKLHVKTLNKRAKSVLNLKSSINMKGGKL